MSHVSPIIPDLMELLRKNRSISVTDEGAGCTITLDCLRYFKLYVSPTGRVHSRYEYPMHSRNPWIRDAVARSLNHDGIINVDVFNLRGDLHYRYKI